MDISAKEIRCPEKHIHSTKKTSFYRKLLIVGDDHLSVYCREHGWIKIEFFRLDEKINFEDVRVKMSSHGPGANFLLSPIPGIAIGQFKSKKKRYASTNS